MVYCVGIDRYNIDVFHPECSKRRSFLGSIFRRSSGATPTHSTVPEVTPTVVATPPPSVTPKDVKTVKVPRCRTNAMVVSLGSLAKEPKQSEGELESCLQCGAVVSCLSSITASNGFTMWTW